MNSFKDFIVAALPWLSLGSGIAIVLANSNSSDLKEKPSLYLMLFGMLVGGIINTTYGILIGMLVGYALGLCFQKK